MRSVLLAILIATFSPSPLGEGRGEGRVPRGEGRHVAVISVDGLGASELFGGPTCVSPRSTLRALADRGAYSHGVRSVLPAITYPAHATLSTGTLPSRHGVHDNGRGGEWFKERSNIAVGTLWDAARRAGKSVAIVTWPSTYGADADWLVPEDLANQVVATPAIRAGSTPGLFDSLVSAVGAPQLVPFAQPEAGTPLDEMTARFAAEIVRRHRPALLLTHFLDYDHYMHARPWSPEACGALERIDGHIARILDAYREAGVLDRTTVFVISDHGFAAVEKVVNVFAMLDDAGWSGIFPGRDVAGSVRVALAGGAVAFEPAPGFGFEEEKLARLRARVEKRYGHVVRWITDRQADAMGGYPHASFVLCARPGYSVTARAQGAVFIEPMKYRGAHGYCPDEPEMNAAFIASGYGVRKAGAVGRIPMADVAPTIAGFAGIALPEATGRDRAGDLRLRSFPERARGR